MGVKRNLTLFLRCNSSEYHKHRTTNLKTYVTTKRTTRTLLDVFRVGLWSCFTSVTCHVTLVKNQVISHERGNEDGIVTETHERDNWSSVTQIFHNGKSSQDDDWLYAIEVMTSTWPLTSLRSVASLLAATLILSTNSGISHQLTYTDSPNNTHVLIGFNQAFSFRDF